MCGIFGFLGEISDQEFSERLSQVTHRGPDGFGVWSDKIQKIHLGHRRLAIIDLSDSGKQPLFSQNNRYVISYNGEIYNYIELKKNLPEIQFKGHSDAEVLVEYFNKFGLKKTLQDIKGMFAIALYDLKEKKLFLIRDRCGEKPLFYGQVGQNFMFGSQLKSFVSSSNQFAINEESIQYFLTLGVIPAPLTIYKRVYKVPSASFVSIQLTEKGYQISEPEAYWSLPPVNQKVFATKNEFVERVKFAMEESVRGQLVGDVPIGAFLSGGVDSSIIAALAQKQLSKPLKTFSVKFSDAAYDESAYAKKYADSIGSEHHELYLDEKELLEYVDAISTHYDEPFADSSQLATMAISKLARQHVTVVLSGDGGDELFGGYNRYQFAHQYLKNILKFSRMSSLGSQMLNATISAKNFEKIIQMLGVPLSHPQMKFKKIVKALEAKSLQDYYHSTVNQWTGKTNLLGCDSNLMWKVNDTGDWVDDLSRADFKGYMQDDVLVKVDRGSMAFGLEVRAPFLDRNVIELAFQMPSEFKVTNNETKLILKSLRQQLYPNISFMQKKMGFSIPLDKWFREDLKDQLNSELRDSNNLIYAYVSQAETIALLDQYYAGEIQHVNSLWALYVLSQWFKTYKQS